MVNATFASDAPRRIARTSCPVCGQPHLEFSLRCDIGGPECLFIARCTCGAAFDIDADSFPTGLTGDNLRDGNVECPTCGDRLAVVTFTCSSTSHQCRYGLTCHSCAD